MYKDATPMIKSNTALAVSPFCDASCPALKQLNATNTVNSTTNILVSMMFLFKVKKNKELGYLLTTVYPVDGDCYIFHRQVKYTISGCQTLQAFGPNVYEGKLTGYSSWC